MGTLKKKAVSKTAQDRGQKKKIEKLSWGHLDICFNSKIEVAPASE